MNKTESLTSALAASSSKGVQKLYTKLRHKIGDNFISHHTSSSGSKRGKTANTTTNDPAVTVMPTVSAAPALSDVSKVPNGEKFISENNFKRTQGMLKHQRISNKARKCKTLATTTTTKSSSPSPERPKTSSSTLQNVEKYAASTKNKSMSPATTTTTSATKTSIYVDSDDEYPFNVTTKSSLEDEIFEELEKVAHDEIKLHAVLKNFDNILSEYNSSCLAATKPTSSNKTAVVTHQAKLELQSVSPSRQEKLKVGATEHRIARLNAQLKIVKISKLKNWKSCSNILEKCTQLSGRSLTGRYKSLNNVSAEYKPANASVSNQFKKSLHAPSTLKTITRKNNLTRKLLNAKHNSPAPRLQSKSTWDLAAASTAAAACSKIPINKTAALKKRSASLCDFNVPNSNKQLRVRRSIPNSSQPPPSPNANKTLKINTVSAAAARSKVNPSKIQQSNNTATAEKKPLMRNVTKKSPASVTQVSRQNSNILLEKCLEKGHEILRKVEAMQADVATVNNDKKSFTVTPMKKSKSFTCPKKTKSLNYADDQQINTPKLESCRIIPPIIGETSSANAKLLVNVIQIKPNIVQKQYDVIVDCKNILKPTPTPTSSFSAPLPNEKINDCDSDDSGHISNDNDSNQSQQSIIESGSKIAKLLRKFEKLENPAKDTPTTISAAQKIILPNKPCISTVKVAKLEPIKCIHTQVEIYPTYSKEVTIRLL